MSKKEPIVSRTAAVKKFLSKSKPMSKAAAAVIDITPKKKVRDPSFWDDPPEVVAKAAQEAAALAPTKRAKAPTNELAPLPERLRTATAPEGFFGLQCGSSHVLILGTLNKDWKDLYCFNFQLECTMHLKREDLAPKEAVDNACRFLQALK